MVADGKASRRSAVRIHDRRVSDASRQARPRITAGIAFLAYVALGYVAEYVMKPPICA